MGRSSKSLIGNRYGKLLVTEFIERNQHNNSRWFCVCDCGGTTEAYYQNLVQGKVSSCGCLKRGRKKAPPST
jgi:hypothetical protein